MSSITNLAPAPPALPSLNLHAHGHKRGVHARALDDSGAEAQASAGATQNLFGRLLQSLEKVIGVQLGTAAGSSATTATSATASKLSGTNINITA